MIFGNKFVTLVTGDMVHILIVHLIDNAHIVPMILFLTCLRIESTNLISPSNIRCQFLAVARQNLCILRDAQLLLRQVVEGRQVHNPGT